MIECQRFPVLRSVPDRPGDVPTLDSSDPKSKVDLRGDHYLVEDSSEYYYSLN